MLQLWLSTCPDDFAGEYDQIEEMFDKGLSRLILYKRRATPDTYERWLLSLSEDYRDRIWVHGTPDVAEQLEVRGCIAPINSLMGEVPESWKRNSCCAMCRNLDQLDQLPDWLSGAFVGPIFPSFSMLEAPQTLNFDEFKTKIAKMAENSHSVPIIPWGGLDEDNLKDFKELPVAGLSFLGGIWNYADPVNAFIKLKRSIKL